jgi:hydroxypyruvate isomerase
VRLLYDAYHSWVMDERPEEVLAGAGELLAHVQIADAPGRHEPGSGNLDLDRYLSLLAAAGYAGWVGLEYQPSGASADSFAWLPRRRRQGGPA